MCGAEGTNKSTCPLNPDAKKPNPQKHKVAQKAAQKSGKKAAGKAAPRVNRIPERYMNDLVGISFASMTLPELINMYNTNKAFNAAVIGYLHSIVPVEYKEATGAKLFTFCKKVEIMHYAIFGEPFQVESFETRLKAVLAYKMDEYYIESLHSYAKDYPIPDCDPAFDGELPALTGNLQADIRACVKYLDKLADFFHNVRIRGT